MKSIIKLCVLLVTISLFTACSFDTIAPATKGKILTTAGYSNDILEPGKYTLWGRDKMVTLDTSTNTYLEAVNVKLADKLELQTEVRFRVRVAGTTAVINSMFNDIPAGPDFHVAFSDVYNVYGQMAVRNVVREIISPYNVDEVHQNYVRLSDEISAALKEALVNTPLEVSEVALGNIEYPEVVVTAINEAEERRLQIAREEAQAAIDILKAENARIVAEANYQVEMTRARTIRDTNATIAEGITPEILELRKIEALELMATNQNAVFMPFDSINSPGAQVRMFNQQVRN